MAERRELANRKLSRGPSVQNELTIQSLLGSMLNPLQEAEMATNMATAATIEDYLMELGGNSGCGSD